MPSDVVLKATNFVHRTMLKVSGGRLGKRFFGMPSLELTTTGRKSGRPHAVMLTAPIVEGDSYIIVASRGGDPMHPAWFWNIQDNPEVMVSFQSGPQRPMTAQVLSEEERARLWPRIVADYPTYGDYQKRTSRQIPLVRLTSR
ncbi:nitroreductase family deazaflavin-dependent oxidoreductase [Nocardia donostiensis]|uniref:Nitroreductase n=1 Tax=Nocardia donostiensis TaxID=1538463 RepID=A0A1V2TF26_9NOCA|nr:nitroreductase family deazaflavin-dependent oxidoreductase [Nocardia donostiensis]ONM48120.1 nitroreductase [Nocardia donostiensis]OQS13892.1 nitroreductase [Nocardia donostiensis]OQS20349.1 nitroreductase [Nocardia donostiensis]